MQSLVLFCVAAAAYLLAAAFTHQRGEDVATGDELHYLRLAESIVCDADVNLANNPGQLGSFPLTSHCILSERGWFSVHNLGLPVLISLPWAVGGPFGARLIFALCAGLAAPLLYRVINAVWQQPRGSCALALALALGMPLVHASSQIYPDLPAGILLLFLAGRALSAQTEPPRFGWRALLAPFAFAFLPWLHIKYAACATIACGWYALAGQRRRWLPAAAALAASLAVLACYNWYAFGKPTGPYEQSRDLAAGINNFIVFMGLHFDQAQGMFLQQPLWLLGLVGLAPMWRASRRNCAFWMLLYASAIVPNSLHTNWYGGYSFIGRFGATAMLLWAIPLAHAARAVFAADWRVPAALAAVSLVLQLCFAGNWLRGAENLMNQCDRPALWRPYVWSYNGFFPYSLRDYLPYWQPFVAFWQYPANFAAWIVAGGLMMCGLCLPRWRAWGFGCVLSMSLVAVCLVAAMPPKMPLAACTGDQLPEFAAVRGRKVETQRIAREGVDAEGPLAFAHSFFPRPGDYRVVVRFQAQGSAEPVGQVMFIDGKTLTVLSTLHSEAGQQQSVNLLHVPRGKTPQSTSVVVYYTGRGTLSVAQLEVERRTR